jgi:predicted dehydrogenase
MLERDDMDAVILADAQGFGLWPVEAACRLGKPVFCAVPLGLEEARAEALLQQVTASGLPVMVEMLPRYAPVVAPLRRLLHNTLGPVRFVLGEVVQAADDAADGAMVVLDWCVCLLESTPASVQAGSIDSAGIRSQFWEMAAGWGLQIVQRRAVGVKPALRLKVIADKGTAQVVLPRRLAWTEADGRHTHLLPRGQPLVQVQLAKFAEAVQGRESVTPNLCDAYRQLGWLRAVEESQTEGRRVSV